jgi:hypothetical protein
MIYVKVYIIHSQGCFNALSAFAAAAQQIRSPTIPYG